MNIDKINKLFQIVENDKIYRDHLFMILGKSQKPPIALLKPLYEKGYFNPENNPKLIESEEQKGSYKIPHWDILDYLENLANFLKKNPGHDQFNLFQKIIEDIAYYRDADGQRIDNYRTDWCLIKIFFSLPAERIKSEYVDFIRTALNSKWSSILVSSEIPKSVFPVLIESNKKELLLKLLNVVLDFRQISESENSDELYSIVDSYWLNESFSKFTHKIIEICSLDAVKVAVKKMDEIIKFDNSQFDSIWISTIENHKQTPFPDRYECQFTYFIRNVLESLHPNTIRSTVLDFLYKEHPIFNRVAFHIINYHYSELKQLFWEYKGNPLETYSTKHEIYELLKKNASTFRNEEINKIIDWIESEEYFIPDEFKKDENKKSEYLAYYKKEWLSALINNSSGKIKSLYTQYDQICPENPSHPGFDHWTESRVGTSSPCGAEELIKKENIEIAQILIDFKPDGGWDSPTEKGLSDTLKSIVTKDPSKFCRNLEPFIAVDTIYHYSILYGFLDAARAKSELDWKVVFDFAQKAISVEDFWTKEYSGRAYHYRDWIISAISDLINEGSRNDEYSFDIKLFPIAKDFLFTFADKAESKIEDDHDIVNKVLNCCKGKIYKALINLSLRYARANNLPEKNSWEKSIKNEFNRRLDRNVEKSLEFYAVLGQYLHNLLFLDANWVWENINKIFPKKDEIYWKSAFSGYLLFPSGLYIYIYKKLKAYNHYDYSLSIKFSSRHINEKIAQHICIAYNEGIENLEDNDSLILKLLNSDDTDKINTVISFFWMQRESITEKIRSKIKPLWRKLFTIVQEKISQDEYKKIAGSLVKWLSIIESIDDEIYSWLNFSVKYLKNDFSLPFFIEYLLLHLEKTPEYVGNLLLATIQSGFYPDYKREDIIQIVDFLFNNYSAIAIKICNLYQVKGIYFLRETFEKYKKAGKT